MALWTGSTKELAIEIQCPAPDCQYKTPEMDAQLAVQR